MPRFPVATRALAQAAGDTAELVVLEHCASTNAELLAVAATSAPLTTIVTEDQRAGRGRLDRRWEAPAGSALAVSMLVREPELSPTALGWIPVLAGLAMAEACEAVGLPAARLKWPNDVLLGDRKLCGVLVERATTGELVVGAGVNTRMSSAELPVPHACSLATAGVAVDEIVIDRLLATYLEGLAAGLAALRAAGGDAIASGLAERVRRRSATLGRTVRVELPGGSELCGEAVALEADARLRVRADDGQERVVGAGDVVHLR